MEESLIILYLIIHNKKILNIGFEHNLSRDGNHTHTHTHTHIYTLYIIYNVSDIILLYYRDGKYSYKVHCQQCTPPVMTEVVVSNIDGGRVRIKCLVFTLCISQTWSKTFGRPRSLTTWSTQTHVQRWMSARYRTDCTRYRHWCNGHHTIFHPCNRDNMVPI